GRHCAEHARLGARMPAGVPPTRLLLPVRRRWHAALRNLRERLTTERPFRGPACRPKVLPSRRIPSRRREGPMGIYDQKPWLKLYDAAVPHHTAPRFESALDMFRDAVRRAPDRPLLHYFDRTFTVAEVDRLSDALALGFQELGFRPGDRVAAYLQNVPQFV